MLVKAFTFTFYYYCLQSILQSTLLSIEYICGCNHIQYSHLVDAWRVQYVIFWQFPIFSALSQAAQLQLMLMFSINTLSLSLALGNTCFFIAIREREWADDYFQSNEVSVHYSGILDHYYYCMWSVWFINNWHLKSSRWELERDLLKTHTNRLIRCITVSVLFIFYICLFHICTIVLKYFICKVFVYRSVLCHSRGCGLGVESCLCVCVDWKWTLF